MEKTQQDPRSPEEESSPLREADKKTKKSKKKLLSQSSTSGRMTTDTSEGRGLIYIENEEGEKTPKERSSLKKSKSTEQKNKEIEESFAELADLLPQGVNSVQKLKELYEEKRITRKRNHLDCIPKVHEDGTYSVIFSPDYNFIISGSIDSIKIFDAETKQLSYHLKEAHQDIIKILAMTSDMKYLISASLDKSLKIFNFKTMEPVYHFKDVDPEDNIMSLAITPDNKSLVVGFEKGSLKIFDIESRQEVYHEPKIHKGKFP